MAIYGDGASGVDTLGCGAITTTGSLSGSSTLHAVGAATFGAAVAATGSITSGGSFIIGSADLDETDLEKLDGISNGTALASKALVLDSSKGITGITQLTASYISGTSAQFTDLAVSANSLTVGGTTINATEMAFLDEVTAGTAAASKAVVLGASREIATIGALTIDGAFTNGATTLAANGNVTGMGTVGCGAVTSTGAGSFGGALDCDTSFTLDTVTVDATELGFLDGVSAGTAAASKALVLDANKNIGTINRLSASYIEAHEIDVNILNSITVTTGTLEVRDKLIIAASGASDTLCDGGGIQVGGTNAAVPGGAFSMLWDNDNSSVDFNVDTGTYATLTTSGFTVTGVVSASSTLSAVGAVTTAGGLNLQSSGISNAGAIAGATTLGMGGALTGVTTLAASQTATIEGVVSGAAGTFDALAGTSLALQSGGITAAGAIAGATTVTATGAVSGAAGGFLGLTGTSLALQSGGITAAGAIAGVTTLGMGGALTGVTSLAASLTATIEGAVSGAAGTFDALAGTSLALQSGGITAAGAIAGATTIAASSTATIEGVVSGAAGTFDALAGTSLALQSGGITAAGAVSGVTTLAMGGALSGVTTLAASSTVSGGVGLYGASFNCDGAVTAGALTDGTAQLAGGNLTSLSSITSTNGTFSTNLSGAAAACNTLSAISIGFAGDTTLVGFSANTLTMKNGSTLAAKTLTTSGLTLSDGGGIDVQNGGITNAGAVVGTTLAVTTISSSQGIQITDKTGPYAIQVTEDKGGIKADEFVTYSDRNLKTNIQPMENALDKVMKLEAVTYDKKASGKHEIGFIAQDVAKIVPEVCAIEDGVSRGIDYSRITSLLVGAVKSQQSQISELKAIIEKLQS